MRTKGVLKYPEPIWYAMMPCVFAIDGTGYDGLEIAMTYNGVTRTVEHDTFSGSAYVDMREWVQGFFTYAAPTYGSRNKSYAAISVSYDVRGRHGTTYVSLLSGGSTMFVWGWLLPGEEWNARRTYTWFREYPFFVDVHASSSSCVISGGGVSQTVTLSNGGMWHVPLSASTFATASVVTLTCGGKVYTVRCDDCATGIYLRWLDRHGRICHYLFDRGTDEREISNDSYFRRNLATFDDNGWGGMDGHRDIKTRAQRQRIGAPLVDADTYEMLADIASSPLVEMMLPSEDWTSVRIDGGTWQKSRAALQDFECVIIFDEVTEG